MPALAEHQRAALQRALEILEMRGGVLLADEVGLGKSFIAAEIMRISGGEIDLIVPRSLIFQWRETLREFGVTPRVMTFDGLVKEHTMPRPGRLVVVDEAHAFRNPKTQRYAALARLTSGAKVVLVTATPMCNSIGDLEALVGLLARDDLLADAGVPSIDVAFATRERSLIDSILEALVIRRDRGVLPEALRFGSLDRIVARHPVLEAPIIDELRFPLIGEHALLRHFLRRRLESSEAALIESVQRQIRFYARALDAIQHGRTLPKSDYRRAFAHEENRDAFQEVLFWELFAPAGSAEPEEIRSEMTRLELLLSEARESPHEKRRMLIEIVRTSTDPILVFTGSAATARDLGQVLAGVRRCGVVTSRERSREAVLEAFRRGRLDLVVSTDLAAEGLDLQVAGTVIHYDLPWNPVKLDQRNGRAHRIGQKRERVRAIYFLPLKRQTGIVETIARKNRQRRRVIEGQHQPITMTSPPTLRPRLAEGAAFHRLRNATSLPLPDVLARRHKAGIEAIMEEMAKEFLDMGRILDLVALVEAEK